MKKLLTICLIMLCAFFIKAQTGTGVIAQINSPYAFTPTTVDSTTTIDVVFVNTVAAQQTLTLTGIAAPFSISSNSVLIGASDSTTIQLSFNPTLTGNFTNTLSWTGSIFGNGSLVVNGEGVQVAIVVSADSLNLGSTSIGNTLSTNLSITNNGSGTMIVSNITSSNAYFSVSPTSLTIAQGNTSTITITYNAIISGSISSILTIYSNDPYNPTYNVFMQASAVSELSGALSDTLYAISSPYNVTGNISVSSGSHLYLEPGVYIDGNGYEFNCEGQLFANGTQSDSITFMNFNILDIKNTDSLTYCNIDYDRDELELLNISFNSQSSVTNFFNNLPTATQAGNGYNYNYAYYNSSGYFHLYKAPYISNPNVYTNPFIINSDRCIIEIDQKVLGGEILYSLDGGSNYTSLDTWGYSSSRVRDLYIYDLSNVVNSGDSIVLKFLTASTNYAFNIYNLQINSFDDLQTNLYTSVTQPSVINNSTINSADLSFGGGPSFYGFEDGNLPSGWSENVSSSSYGVYNYNYNAYAGDWYYYLYSSSGTYDFTTQNYTCGTSISLDFKYDYDYNNQGYGEFTVEYCLNNGSWQTLLNTSSTTSGYVNSSHSISTNVGDLVKFRFEVYTYSNRTNYIYIDNISINSPNPTDKHIFFNNSTISSKIYAEAESFTANNCVFIADDYSFNASSLYEQLNLHSGFKKVNLINCDFNNYSMSVGSSLDTLIVNQSNFDGRYLNYGITGYAEIKNSNFTNSTSNSLSIGGVGTSYLENIIVRDASANGIDNSSNNLKIKYSFIEDNGSVGINNSGSGSNLELDNTSISRNNSHGINNSGYLYLNYANVNDNIGKGIYQNSTQTFTSINNSILWNNQYSSTFSQIYISYSSANDNGGLTLIDYSSIQGINSYGITSNSGISNSNRVIGAGAIDANPLYVDNLYHLGTLSDCIDGGYIYESDNFMPQGLGGPRSDMGMYGGPENWYWGGSPALDGSPLITSIEDSPQDQGGLVGVLFNASLWDDASISNNVTGYSIWRNFDVNGVIVDSLQNGNWELLGDMPANNINAYAYSATTLGDSNLVSGMFNSCFFITAHTGDSSTYWYSNVLCGYSTDDIAPSAPIASAMAVANTDDVVVYWDAPAVPDYAYSNVISSNGFTSLGVVDTMTLDVSTLSGGTYTYGVVHFDVNGNASDTAWVTITLADNEDVIPLTAGWNLISTNKSPNNNDMTNIFSSLMPGNLVYVTAFNQGSSLYNPNGLPFLNTLTQFTDGYGYWVKVLVDDTLSISGTTIPATYKIPLNANWNLSGYM
ncbi:MAG: DUF1573 domain-containing protein, partial [Flavobacteriales bacterium]|nr:DUF1573 domain-containing protein [Flavobacteriales bacterium]